MRFDEIKPSVAKDILSYSSDVQSEHLPGRQDDDAPILKYDELPLQKMRDWFKNHGFKYIGTGAHSTIYLNDDANLVVKVTDYDDECFEAFAKYAHKHKNNPHLPRVSIPKKFDVSPVYQSFYITFIEKLEPIETEYDPNMLLELSRWSKLSAPDVTKEHLRQSLSDWFLGSRKKVFQALKFLKENKKLVRTLQEIYDHFDSSGCIWDTHFNNFMKRKNGDIVISDPVAGIITDRIWQYREE